MISSACLLIELNPRFFHVLNFLISCYFHGRDSEQKTPSRTAELGEQTPQDCGQLLSQLDAPASCFPLRAISFIQISGARRSAASP